MNIPNSLKEMVTDQEPDLEHRKAADFYATWEYTVTPEDRAEYGDESWDKFIGLSIHASGIWNDNWGSEVSDWTVYRPTETQSKANKEFWSLMSHLNSEDNDMAFEFAEKHFPPKVSLEKVEEPKDKLLAATIPAMSVAKAVAND